MSFDVAEISVSDNLPDNAARKVNRNFESVIRVFSAFEKQVNERLRNLEDRMDEVEKRLDKVEEEIEKIKQEIAEIWKKIEELEERIEALESAGQ